MIVEKSKPVVAIVGRPNVGKSTLFNRIVGRRIAIVEDLPGVTRDRNYFDAEHDGREFILVDTGGFEPDAEDRLIQQVRDQARLAVDEAQVVVLVVDGVAGPTGVDEEIAAMLRKSGKPLFLAVNKIDSWKREEEGFLAEFYSLGLERVYPVSGEHGRGVSDMLDAVIGALPEPLPPEPEEGEEGEEPENRPIRLAIIGRPNVGKSTLVNSLIGEERFVTSPVAGTTRDPVDATLSHKGRDFVITDTAGIRRKRSIAAKVEAYSVLRSLKAAEASDVVVMLLDATEFAVEQDAKIAGLAEEQGKPLLVVVNKWDQIEQSPQKLEEFKENLVWRMPFLAYCPVIFTSALTGERVKAVLTEAGKLFEQASSRVPTPMLNKLLEEISNHHGLPVVRGARARVYYITQVGIRPPTFVIQTNRPDLIPPEYKRYVSNRLRSVFGLQVPMRLVFKKKASLRAAPKKQIRPSLAKSSPRLKSARRKPQRRR